MPGDRPADKSKPPPPKRDPLAEARDGPQFAFIAANAATARAIKPQLRFQMTLPDGGLCNVGCLGGERTRRVGGHGRSRVSGDAVGVVRRPGSDGALGPAPRRVGPRSGAAACACTPSVTTHSALPVSCDRRPGASVSTGSLVSSTSSRRTDTCCVAWSGRASRADGRCAAGPSAPLPAPIARAR